MDIPNTVLLVDDEAHMRQYLKTILKKMGVIHVLEAEGGEAALDIYQRELPELVLLDVSMPGMNGLQVLRELKREYPHARVIMMTSIAAREVVVECLKAGAANYLLKDGAAAKCEDLLKRAIAKIGE